MPPIHPCFQLKCHLLFPDMHFIKVCYHVTLTFGWNALFIELFSEMHFIKVCHQFALAFAWNAFPTTVWGTDTSLCIISCNRHLSVFFEQQEVQKMSGQGLISTTQISLKFEKYSMYSLKLYVPGQYHRLRLYWC